MREVSTQNKIPARFVVGTILICSVPFVLQSFGVDFGTHVFSGAVTTADEFRTLLRGSFIHTILEWSAFMTAIMTVMFAFSHFKIAGDITTVIIGVVLFCSGAMDAFHMFVVTQLIDTVVDNSNLISFTWTVCRVFDAGIMIVGVGMFLGSQQKIHEQKSRFGFVIGVSIFFSCIAYVLINYAATHREFLQMMYLNSVITRLYDVLPLILFLIAGLFVYPQFYRKYPSLFSRALILSAIPEVMVGMHMAFGSISLHDSNFNIAHFLKIIAHLIPFIGLCLDYVITYRKLHDIVHNLERSEEETRAIVETAINGVVVADEKGIIRLFNPMAEKIFGYSREEAVGKNVKILMPESYDSHHDVHLMNHKATGQRKALGMNRELTGRRKDGSTFPLYIALGSMTVRKKNLLLVSFLILQNVKNQKGTFKSYLWQ